ncbi:MAG: hypothetical protein AB7O78_09895 [Thermoleophilia bacterium]
MLVLKALQVSALVEVEAAGEEPHPKFPTEIAAALVELRQEVDRVAQDAWDLMNAEAAIDDGWRGLQMPPSAGPLDGSAF